jgi:uncharacterized protein YbjT (DUF2867 family)
MAVVSGNRAAAEILVTGAGGFIGGHLVAELRRRGAGRIRAVDVKPFHARIVRG